MAFYLLVEVAILAYTPVMCNLRSLRVGTLIGATGFFLGLILGLLVFPISRGAFFTASLFNLESDWDFCYLADDRFES